MAHEYTDVLQWHETELDKIQATVKMQCLPGGEVRGLQYWPVSAVLL